MNGLLDGLKALGPGRLAAMGAVALAMLGLLALLMLHGPAEHMSLLYGDLDPREAGQVVDLLERQHVVHRLGANGAEIMVPADQVARARLMLAKEGLPTGGSIGYEIFDRGDSLTTSEFQQQINVTRAMEGELSRTIRGLSGVRNVRVHLVLPKREPFERQRQEAQASVMLTMVGASRMDNEGVQAILNLISAAVSGLRPQNIAIIDSRGNVLSRAGAPTGIAGAVQTTEEIRRATEVRISRAVEEMLERGLGPGRVRAEATVNMDFDQVHETKETFDPDGQVARSTQSVTDNNRTTEANNNVTVQNNLPNATAGQDAAGSQQQKQEETTNYEISKTVRTLVREQPQIHRISLAVMVDGAEEKGPDGKMVWRPRTQDEIDHITRLVRSAIGYDEKRGDTIDVVNMRFVAESDDVATKPAGWLSIPVDRIDMVRLGQTALLGAVVLAALLLVLRPMVLKIAGPMGGAGALAGPGGAGAFAMSEGGLPLTAADATALIGAPGQVVPALGGGVGGTGAEDESMVQLTNIEGNLRASSIRKLSDLVEKHPEESLTIVRAWMTQER